MGVQGSTDSEWAFAVFLDCLEKAGYDPDNEEYARDGFGHVQLRKAMLCTIRRINDFVDATPVEMREESMDKRSLLNFAVADGHSLVCTKYVSSKTDEAASLYFSSGTSWKEGVQKGQYKMERRDKGADIVLVASEPLTFERGMYTTTTSNIQSTAPQPTPTHQNNPKHHRQLGNSPHKLHHNNPQTNRHDPPHHRRILQPQPLVYSLERICC